MKKIFRFTGFGNYSESFGWDNGMYSQLGEEVSIETLNDTCLEGRSVDPDVSGVYQVWFNDHAGSRNAAGFVVAEDMIEASGLLSEEDASWRVMPFVYNSNQ
jgi:hypothetical protein